MKWRQCGQSGERQEISTTHEPNWSEIVEKTGEIKEHEMENRLPREQFKRNNIYIYANNIIYDSPQRYMI